MKSPSIDNFYTKLDKQILLAQSYTEIGELFFIIKACRLKPYSYIFEKREEKIVLYRHWVDEFGNSLHITTKKRLKPIYNDVSLKRDSLVCTDLYHGLSLDKIAKISKLAYLCLGKDEDLYQDCAVVTFLGIDNYLRSYQYLYGEWRAVSPLSIGVRNLRIIGKHRDIKYFHQFDIKENMPIPCISSSQWLTFVPPSQAFLTHMEKGHEFIAPLFKQRNDSTHG
jgi:hypothetical protein